MNNQPVKVVNLQTNSVYQDIMTFLNDLELKSRNTRIAYETDIRQFFRTMRNKDIEQLTREDLYFKHSEVLQYRKILIDQGKSPSTVNRKMSSIKSLFEYLERDYSDIRSAVFNVDRLREETSSYGVLTLEEAWQMMDRVRKQYKGMEKSLLIEMAVRTSFRLSALLDLRWSNFTKHNNFWLVAVYDKGKKLDEKPIPDEFYQRLQFLKGKYDDDKVFHLDRKTCERMVKELAKEMGLDPKRNITFHSLKKVAINWVLQNGGDILTAARQGNHSSIQTTYRHYVNKNKDYHDMPGLAIDNQIDTSVLEDLSKDELIKLINSASNSVKTELLSKLKRKNGS